MSDNFKIEVRRKQKYIHFFLYGDLDGSTACEAVNAIKDKTAPGCRVAIHTAGVRNRHPFGEAVFRKRLAEIKGLAASDYPDDRIIEIKPLDTGKTEKEVLPCW